MQFQVDLDLSALRCVQPDEGEDDPYLWTFFFNLDGSTVQQVQPEVFQLAGSVQITAGHGAHRNLSSPVIVSGQTIRIPANVGSHHTKLRPIRLQMLRETILIPGRLVAFCILMEEDATADGSILKAHASLRNFLELQWNTFLNSGLSQETVTRASTELQEIGTTLTGRALILAAVERVIDQFVDGLEGPAVELVREAVIDDSGLFDLIANFFDADDSMGTLRLAFDERQIINAGLQIPIHMPIIRTEDGTWTSYYEIYGGLHARLLPSSSDLEVQMIPAGSAALNSGAHTFDRDYLCIPKGTRVEWTVTGSEQEAAIRFTYPFLDVRWTVGGVALPAQSGTVEFFSSCSFPEFEPSKPPRLVKSRSEQRQVKVRYEIQDEGDAGRLLRLWNHRDDGNFSFIVDVIGLVPNAAELLIGSEMISFSGQELMLGPDAFTSAFNKCLAQIASISDEYAKSKRITPKDLWNPQGRFKEYETMIEVVDNMAVLRGVDEAQIAMLKEGIARKMRMKEIR